MSGDELPIIQATYDLIKWYVPILNKLPKDHRFGLGDRMVTQLYEMLEGLIQARYLSKNRAYRLEVVNTNLDILRYQTRLLLDFQLISNKRYNHAGKQLRAIPLLGGFANGQDVGGWLKQQRSR